MGTFLTREIALFRSARGGWKGTFDGEAAEEEQEEKEEGFSSFFLSFSFSFSRLFQEIFIIFFRCRSNYIRSSKRGEKEKRITTTRQKKRHHAPALSSFVRTIIPFIIFRRHSRYVRTLLLRKQEIILVLHLPRTPKEEKRKKRIFIRDCTRSTRSNER